jgi:hypothetical protein
MPIPCRTQVWKPSAKAEQIFAQKLLPAFEKFCAERQHRWNQTELLMWCCNQIPFGHSILPDFTIAMWQMWWPHMFFERRGYINTWLVRMVKALCTETHVNFMGCGAGGKSKICGAHVYSMWKLKPTCTSCFVSSTSFEALDSRIWGYVKDWHKTDTTQVGKLIDSRRIITLDEEVRNDDGTKERDYRNGIKGVAIKTGQEGKNAISSIVGRHNKRVIWVYDEFGFMDSGILDGRINLNTNQFSQCVGLGNAPSEGDIMHMDCEPQGSKYPDGWRSLDKDVDEDWPTRAGRCFYFNGAKSPNFQVDGNQPTLFEGIMDESFRLKVLKDSGGEDSPYYWKQFFGFPPGVDISDKVVTHKLLEQHGALQAPIWVDDTRKTLAGLDLGFRADGDPCVIHFGRIGKDTRDKTIIGLEPDGVPLVPSQRDKSPFEAQIARRVIEECRKRDCHDLALDVTGDGGILLQHIEREARAQNYKLDVLPVSFSGTAEDRIVIPGEKRTARDMFSNMVAQIWGAFRLSIINEVVRGLGEFSKAKQQLCERKMGTDEKKRMTIERKVDMKKRIRRSPDQADALCLLGYLALRHGLSGASMSNTSRPLARSPREALERALGTGESAYSGHGNMGRYGGR